MSTNGRVIHYIGWVVTPLNPRKFNVFNGNFGFDLRNVSQERKRGVKGDLPV